MLISSIISTYIIYLYYKKKRQAQNFSFAFIIYLFDYFGQFRLIINAHLIFHQSLLPLQFLPSFSSTSIIFTHYSFRISLVSLDCSFFFFLLSNFYYYLTFYFVGDSWKIFSKWKIFLLWKSLGEYIKNLNKQEMYWDCPLIIVPFLPFWQIVCGFFFHLW